jgi:O-antigen/teichoic acid export membrane protein
MIDEGQVTIRNAGFLLTQRGFHILGSLLFAALVPRLMGPHDYGRYALITSLYFWFVILSDLGFPQIMGRYVPLFILQGEEEKLQKFFSNLLTLSLVSGALSGCFYLLFTSLCLPDLDLFLFLMMATTIFVRAATHPFFTLFLGLNQAALWGMGEIFRHGLTIVTVIIGFYLNGLQGACLGLFLTELVVLSIGIGWGKSYFSWKDLCLDLRYLLPYLRFGLMFFVFNLLATAFQHSGEILIRFFYPDYAQVAYYGLAYDVFHKVSVFIPQLTLTFAPFMVTLLAREETKILKQWIEQLIKWLTVGGVIVFFSVLLLGNDLVLLVLGAAYQPVAINLLLLSLMLCVQVLSNVGILLTIVYNRPKIAVMAAGVRVVAMLIFGPLLIARWGSWGGCLAVLAASLIFAGYLTWRMQGIVTYSLQKWALAIALGLPFLPLLWLQSSWIINCALYSIFVVGYVSLLLFLRIITLGELKTVWRGIDPRRRISDLKLQGR